MALHALLTQSGPELFDRSTMTAHLELMGCLLRQTTTYELLAGQDCNGLLTAFLISWNTARRRHGQARRRTDESMRSRCPHCFAERHAATGDLSMEIVDRVLPRVWPARSAICASPAVSRHSIVSSTRSWKRTCRAGYDFSIVTNGRNFPAVSSLLVVHRERFRGVTFSLDGAREATHDRSRGTGSFRRIMRGATVCFFRKLPFTFNMVLTSDNRGEVEEMVQLSARLGSSGVRFGHLILSPGHTTNVLALSPTERREVENHIWALRKSAPVHVDMAPGYFSETPFFPCGPLTLEEYNLDYQGNVTLCCHLSGHAGPNAGDEVLGNLHSMTLMDARRRFHSHVATYLADKRARVSQGALSHLDHFPCWYCVKYSQEMNTEHGSQDAARGQQPSTWTDRMEGDFMSWQAQVRLDPEVVDTELDEGEVALLHLGTKTYFSLNLTGGRIWRHLKQGLSLDEVAVAFRQSSPSTAPGRAQCQSACRGSRAQRPCSTRLTAAGHRRWNRAVTRSFLRRCS